MNKRRGWWLWAIFGGLFLALEGYAIVTKERVVPTLSRVIFWLKDRWAWFASALFVFLIWLTIHLVWGPCALGICP